MLIFFTRQLYILIKAGIPLLKALQIICAQLPPGRFRDYVETIVQEIQQGKSFSEALSSSGRFFSLFYINMIKAAEISGNLTGILKELSLHLTSNRKITREVQAAIMYPVLVLFISISILIVLVIFVVPVFVRVFQDLGGSLPVTTILLIGLSKFIVHWGWLFLALGIAFIVATILLYQKSAYAKHIISTIMWRIPLFGKIIKTLEISRFCRTVGTLLSSGVTLMKGLEVLIDTSTSVLMRQALEDIRYKVEQGKNLSTAMEETGILPLTLVKMIQVGEESGKIADLFLDAAEDYEGEVSFAVTGMLSLLEPVLIVMMGGIVGFIVISLFFPIFTLSTMVK